jgi:peroxiredoxin Q/BCP
MKKLVFLLGSFLMITGFNSAFGQNTAASGGGGVKNGVMAPDFTAKDQDGKTVSLSQFKGQKVVLYFYPKDGTPGCTAEACNLRDNYDALTKAGYKILGVSTDDETSHKAFQTKHNLPFTLIADVDKSIVNKYGVWVEKERDGKKFWGTARTTFIIDENGIVETVISDVNTKEHASQVLSLKPGN